MQSKRYLKTGIVALVAIGLCVWVTYRLLYPDATIHYNDFVIDSSITWLENADDGDFDICRKDIVDKDGWFDWFIKDRKSLEKIKSRKLLTRSELPGGTGGIKRYELKFDSNFSMMKHPKSRITERMIVENDGENQFKVLLADYPKVKFEGVERSSLPERDKQQITAIAAKVLKKVESRDIEFFKRSYAKYATRKNYFGWNEYWLKAAKNPKKTRELFEILDKGNPTPWKLMELGVSVPVGRTGFEAGGTEYRFSTVNNGKKENFKLLIFIERDLYQNKSAPWEFYGLWWRKLEMKQEKK